jgi:hypothetical protein
MGIKNRNGIMDKIGGIGTYHKKAPNYTIYVDGELIRYKGMVSVNLSKHCCEEPIAATSFEFLKNTLQKIQLKMLNKQWDSVVVYMDGARVQNKVYRAHPELNFDASLVRKLFKEMCIHTGGYEVIELQYGESELQMYLQRDKLNPLNIFVTSDSDMISICYDHKVKIFPIDKPQEEILNELENNDESNCIPIADIVDFTVKENVLNYFDKKGIYDYNDYYDTRRYNVYDSCAWYHCGSNQTKIIGFDTVCAKLQYEPHVFRTFLANCGTDFTEHLFTNSMIDGILSGVTYDERKYINKLDNSCEISAALLFLAIRGKGVILRNKNNGKPFDLHGFKKSIDMYKEYIKTGKMCKDIIPHPNLPLLCRHFIYAMKAGNDETFVQKALQQWSKRISLEEAIENFRLHIGTYKTEKDRIREQILFNKKCFILDFKQSDGGSNNDDNVTTTNTDTINETADEIMVQSNRKMNITQFNSISESLLNDMSIEPLKKRIKSN